MRPPFKAWHGPDRLPSGVYGATWQNHPLFDWSNLRPQELAHGLLSQQSFWVTLKQITGDDLTFFWTTKKRKKPCQAFWKAATVVKPLSDVFFLTSPSWLAFQHNAKEWFYAASRLSGWFQKSQKECAKLGSTIITAHLWALWTKIVHFPSESLCRPIIRIILGTTRVSSGHCMIRIYLAEPQELPWTQTIAPQCKRKQKTDSLLHSSIPRIKLWLNSRKPLSTFGALLGGNCEHVLLVYCSVTLLSFVCNKRSENIIELNLPQTKRIDWEGVSSLHFIPTLVI